MHARATTTRWSESKPQLTPMVDIVFLLLIFFVIAFRPTQLLSELHVGVSESAVLDDTVVPSAVLVITVAEGGYLAHDKPMTLKQVRAMLTTIGGHSVELPILVKSDVDATHSRLIKLLDACDEYGLERVSLSL